MEHPPAPLGDDGATDGPDRRDSFRRREDVDLRVAVENLTNSVRAHNRENEALRRRIRWQAVGYVLLLVLLVGGAFGLEHRYSSRVEAEAKLTRQGLVASCDRVNRLRNQDNVNATQIWAALYSGGQREHQLAKGPEAATHRAAALVYDVLAAAMRRTALTDCSQAVGRPTTYAAPEPVPFTTRDFPPALEKALESTPLSPTPSGP